MILHDLPNAECMRCEFQFSKDRVFTRGAHLADQQVFCQIVHRKFELRGGSCLVASASFDHFVTSVYSMVILMVPITRTNQPPP
jgi:nitrite reductase/ring-hydroxylating ferredoxin subunit